MPTLPLPMIGALALGLLFAALVLARDRYRLLSLLVGVCALQGMIIAFGQHYGVGLFRAVQPVTAACIPPLSWVAFQASAVRALQPGRDSLHLTGPIVVLACASYAPSALDLLIPAVFLGYGAVLLLAVSAGLDGMPGTRLETGDVPNRIWGVVAVGLLVSAFIDGAISLAHMADLPHWQPWLVSAGSACMLLMLGGLAVARHVKSGGRGEHATGTGRMPAQQPDPIADAEIVARLNVLLTDQELYLDPDLTLGRLSRRLGIPVKQLSAAINRVTHSNVSRFVNRFRIERACERLLAGESVAVAMDSSGFSTRSNFNREFRRITGKSPSDWRDAETRG